MGQFKFLVMGTGGGGTSLTSACIDSHPEIDMVFERYGEDYLQGVSLKPPVYNITHRTKWYRMACEEAASRSKEEVWGNKLLDSHIRGLNVHNERCDKGQEVDPLSFFLERCIPDIKIILVVRDSRTCLQSKLTRGTAESLDGAIMQWKYLVGIYEYLKRKGSSKFLLIKFEDLVRTPELTCTRMAEFLGLKFHRDMVEKGPVNSKSIYQGHGAFSTDKAPHKFPSVDHPHCTPVLREQKLLGYI